MNIVTRRARFSASHRLFNPNFSDEENDRVFGLCANSYGHGHNYVLEISIKGEPEKETGYVVDLKDLNDLIDRLILKPCDHKHLNFQVPFLKDVIPTVENLSKCFFDVLQPEIHKISKGRLYSVKVIETENNWAEYRHD